MLKNKETGQIHTAKWPMILSFIAGAVILLCAKIFPDFAFAEALPIALGIWALGGVGAGAMKRRGSK